MTETSTAAPDSGVIDLNAGRAARREGKNKDVVITIGAAKIVLPAEFPLDALTPLREVNLDFGMVVGASNPEQVLRDLVITQPQLIVEGIDAAKAVFEGLFCSCEAFQENLLAAKDDPRVVHTEDCSWVSFLRERPSPQDIIALVRGLTTAYGVNLGEALESSTSAGSGGATSSQTSNGSAASTPAKRGGGRRPTKALASASAG